MSSRCIPAARRIGAVLLAALFAVSFDAIAATQADAQLPGFRSPASVPPSWMQFAKLVKFRFEEWIGADDRVAVRFRAYLKIHRGASDGPPPMLTVKAWVKPDGSIERVWFQEFGDPGATKDLRIILTRGNVGEAPPPEMLQPVNLRFSLNIKEKEKEKE